MNENLSPMATGVNARGREALIQPYDDNGELESGRQYLDWRVIDFDRLRPCIEFCLLSAGLLMIVGFVGVMVWAVFWR
jgi:hypothetical protein